MLKFENCFEGNLIERLRERINSIQLEGCVSSFVKYIGDVYDEKDDGSFETKFRRKLCSDSDQVVLRVKMKIYQNMSKEELLKLVESLVYDTEGCIRADAENCSVYEVFDYWNVTDADSYDIIKEYMMETLNKLVEEANKTAKDKAIEEAKRSYEYSKEQLARYSDEVKRFEKNLKELEVDVDEK